MNQTLAPRNRTADNTAELFRPIARDLEKVEAILQDLDLVRVPKLVVFNKTDRLGNGSDRLATLTRRYDAVAVSALRREGLDGLVDTADRLLGEPHAAVQLVQ